ncbi:unnamed protein product, partial [Amoebophrya sp. A25]|eukprot:GSA25T00026573001.1
MGSGSPKFWGNMTLESPFFLIHTCGSVVLTLAVILFLGLKKWQEANLKCLSNHQKKVNSNEDKVGKEQKDESATPSEKAPGKPCFSVAGAYLLDGSCQHGNGTKHAHAVVAAAKKDKEVVVLNHEIRMKLNQEKISKKFQQKVYAHVAYRRSFLGCALYCLIT